VSPGRPELWVRLGRAVPYPSESIRSVTLVAEAGRLYLDVTAEVPVMRGDHDPARVAGIDLGIIHPYAVMAGDEGLLVSGRQIRAEERLHLEDTKRRSHKAAAKAPSKGQRGSRRWRRYRASRRRAEARHRRRVRQAHHETAKSVVAWLVDHDVGTVVVGDPKGIYHQGLRAPPEPGASQLAAHPPAGVPVGQGGAGGDRRGARERAGDVVHLPGVPEVRPQAEGTRFLLPALRASVPPRSGRCPEHRRPGRRIHACTRTRHAPSGRETPGTA
jgi:transposase